MICANSDDSHIAFPDEMVDRQHFRVHTSAESRTQLGPESHCIQVPRPHGLSPQRHHFILRYKNKSSLQIPLYKKIYQYEDCIPQETKNINQFTELIF